MSEPSSSDRLEELMKQKAEREKTRAAAKAARAVEELELEARFDSELGPRGSQFEIVDSGDLGEGFLVVKLGEEVLWKRFIASKMTSDDANNLVRPCVAYPAKEKYDEITARRSALVTRCANALATLYGVQTEVSAGKL